MSEESLIASEPIDLGCLVASDDGKTARVAKASDNDAILGFSKNNFLPGDLVEIGRAGFFSGGVIQWL